MRILSEVATSRQHADGLVVDVSSAVGTPELSRLVRSVPRDCDVALRLHTYGASRATVRALVAALAQTVEETCRCPWTVLVLSADPRVLSAAAPAGWMRALVVPHWVTPASAVHEAARADYGLFFDVRALLTEPTLVRDAHAAGVVVGCERVERPVDAKLLALAGVDAVTTCVPALLSAAIGRRPRSGQARPSRLELVADAADRDEVLRI